MQKIGAGSITLLDVNDGISPSVVQLSNESHSFVCPSNGIVSQNEREAFECALSVWNGDIKCIYTSTDLSATGLNTNSLKNKYSVKTAMVINGVVVDDSDWQIDGVVVGNDLVIKSLQIPANDVALSATVQLTVYIVNMIGNVSMIQKNISLTKLKAGNDGTFIRLDASENYFLADSNGIITLDSPNIEIAINTSGNVGILSYYKKINNEPSEAINLTDNSNMLVDDDNDSSADRIIVSASDMQNCDKITFEVRGNEVQDTLTIVKVKSGAQGEAALTVFISSDTNGNIFKNGSDDIHIKTLTAKVYDMGTGMLINDDVSYNISYSWLKSTGSAGETVEVFVDPETKIVASNVDTETDIKAIESFIKITSDNVDDGGSKEFSCIVKVTQP